MNNSNLITSCKWFAEYDENGKRKSVVYDESIVQFLGYAHPEEYKAACNSTTGMIHHEDKEKLISYISECEKKHPEGKDYDTEYRIMTKNGYHLVHDHAHISRRDDGSVISADGILLDIDKIVKEKAENKLLSENYSRILALVDTLEVLYDVELETGNYEILVRSKTYEDIYNCLVDNNSFWGDLGSNIALAHPEDRQAVCDSLRKDSIRKALSDNDHFDILCRIKSEEKYAWNCIRIAYKNQDKNNVIIGIFNADKEIESRQIEEQKRQFETKSVQLEESLAFTNFFLDTYVSAYYVNLEDFSYRIYKQTIALHEKYSHIKNFYDSIRIYIEHDVHPDDRTELLNVFDGDNLRKVLKNTSAFYHYFRDISDDNEKIYKVQVIRGADGNHAAIGFADLTDDFREQQGHLLGAIPLSSDVLTKANIGLWAFELDEGHAPRMYADEAMLGLIGLDHQISPEDTYHAWYDNIDAGSYDLVSDAVARMTSGEHAEVQYPWHHPNGETWIVRCGGVRNSEYKKGIRIEGTHQNVTELIHYDEEQRKREARQREDEIARIKAEASNKAKTEFLFNMSHDIRTPMNAILGYTNIALNHISETVRVSDSLNKIKTSGSHLLRLINDILEMSRIEAGKMEIVNGPLNVFEAVDGIINMSKSLAATKDISFNCNIDILKNPYIYADELHTNQAIINIISNAIKYTNPGGTVEYTVEQISEPENGVARYRFTVKDNGIGMSADFQEHIFESFSREQSFSVSKEEGTGLGLAIVKRIIDLIGGTISVDSKLGVGSTFVVELPFAVMEKKDIEAYKSSLKTDDVLYDEHSFEGRRVLLVEDNEMNREIATDILEDAGLMPDTAADGSIAVDMVREKGIDYYDFILMDVQMPVMNGYEATAEIRKLPEGNKVPIIALSANAFKEDIDRSLSAGMNAHVAKPINIRELFGTLKNYL